MKKLALTLVFAAITFTTLFWFRKTKEPTQMDASKTLIVGTSADFAPFSFRDAQNEITGFDIAIAKEVARRLNLNILLEDMRFEMLLPELQVGHIHVIASGLTPTQEREKAVNFTKPYLKDNPLVVVTLAKNPKISNIEELKGKEVIVNTGYTADTYMSKLPGMELTRLSSVAEAFTALEQGAGYAFITAANTLKPVLEKKKSDKFNMFIIDGTEENNALAVSKHYPKMLEIIQQALNDMENDGTIDALINQWKIK